LASIHVERVGIRERAKRREVLGDILKERRNLGLLVEAVQEA
jgi:hypothetical protein